MKSKRNLALLSLLVLLAAVAPKTQAQCGRMTKAIKPSAWSPQFGAAQFLRTGDDQGNPIVGMWHVVFTATTSGGATIPATVIDNALAVWHSDRTEIMNSVRPPQDGNFCLGVWEQTGRNQYYLNHFPWYNNEFPNSNASGIGDPVGPTQIQEWITLGPDGCHFTGKFQLTAYDLSNNVTASFTGTLAGTRVTIHTTIQDLTTN
jgi:hypothetical protein